MIRDIYNSLDESNITDSVEDLLDRDFPMDYGNLEDFDDNSYTDESLGF